MSRIRYLLRIESAVAEPRDHPIRSILMDRQAGRYSLLDEDQTQQVIAAAAGILNAPDLHCETPFRVHVELATLPGNVQIVDLHPTREDILSAPISAYLEISNRCNLRCPGCYQGARGDAGTSSTAEVCRFLEDFSRIGGLIIRLTGKEPTIHPDIVPIVDRGTSLGLKMALNTNGVLSLEKIRILVQAGISEVVVSLDGRPATHNALRGADIFDTVVASSREFARLGVDTRINMTVSKVNLADVRFIATLAKECDAHVSYIPMRNIGWAAQRFGSQLLDRATMQALSREVALLRQELGVRLLTYFDIYDEAADYYHPMFQLVPCHSRKNVFVDCAGDTYPCDHLVGLGDSFYGGNVHGGDLLDIWLHGPGLERFRALQLSEACTKTCEHWLKDCNGGCVSEALWASRAASGAIARDRLCPLDL